MTKSVFRIALALTLCLGSAWPGSAAARNASPAKEESMSEQGPSFDCASTRHKIQDLVCKDPELSALDRKLAGIFDHALEKLEAVPNSAPQVRHLKAYEVRWMRERNECGASHDPRACTQESYHRRISELEARFLMVKSRPPVVYECRDNPKNQLVATFVESDPPSVRLSHGDAVTVAVQAVSGSGARYVGERGVLFWIKGNDAMVTWPKGNQFNCTVRK